MIRNLCLLLTVFVASSSVFAQQKKDDKKPAKKPPRPFRWGKSVAQGRLADRG